MDYFEFKDYVKSAVSKILGEEKNVTIRKILKNNNQELDALTIIDHDTNISPTIYLNSYYDEYQQGKTIGTIVNEIYGLYEENSKKCIFDVEMFNEFSNISSKIVYKVINTEQNRKLLADVPHCDRLDLSIVFYCMLDSDYMGNATVLIHNAHLDMWNISQEELVECAFMNTPHILKAELRNMNDIIREMFLNDIQHRQVEGTLDIDVDVDEEADRLMSRLGVTNKDIEMYVLTNKQRMNGAAVMFYDGVLKKFADEKEMDLYILPSSIHEVIIVPIMEGMSKNELTIMVQDVNTEEVEPGEILADHVYVYHRKNDELIM